MISSSRFSSPFFSPLLETEGGGGEGAGKREACATFFVLLCSEKRGALSAARARAHTYILAEETRDSVVAPLSRNLIVLRGIKLGKRRGRQKGHARLSCIYDKNNKYHCSRIIDTGSDCLNLFLSLSLFLSVPFPANLLKSACKASISRVDNVRAHTHTPAGLMISILPDRTPRFA